MEEIWREEEENICTRRKNVAFIYCMHVFLSVFPGSKKQVCFCREPMNFGGITPGAKCHRDQHPAVENRNSEVPAWSFIRSVMSTLHPVFLPQKASGSWPVVYVRAYCPVLTTRKPVLESKTHRTQEQSFFRWCKPCASVTAGFWKLVWVPIPHPLHNVAIWIIRSARC